MENVQEEPRPRPAHIDIRVGAGLFAFLEAYEEHDVRFQPLERADGGEPDHVPGRLPEVHERPFLDACAFLEAALLLHVGRKDDDPLGLDALAHEAADFVLDELPLFRIGLPSLVDYADAAEQHGMELAVLHEGAYPVADGLRVAEVARQPVLGHRQSLERLRSGPEDVLVRVGKDVELPVPAEHAFQADVAGTLEVLAFVDDDGVELVPTR